MSPNNLNLAIVTGCAGFIGINFTKKLLEQGWVVYGIDKLTYAANTVELNKLIDSYSNFTFVKADIKDINWLPEADILFNFAAESDVDNSNNDCYTFVQSNIAGIQNLLNIVNNRVTIRSEKPLFVQISTDEVYGDLAEGSYNETSPLNPSNPYSATKASADLLLQSWHRTHKIDYIIIRPSNNYGKFQYPEKLIPLSVKKLQRNKKIKLHNKGDPVRSWTHVDDTINGILTIIDKGSINTIYNISSGFEQKNYITVQQIINCYFSSDKPIDDYVDFSYNRPGQDVRYSITCNPLRELGWKPLKQFKTEINKLVQEYKENFRW